jgi:hypothetical protein
MSETATAEGSQGAAQTRGPDTKSRRSIKSRVFDLQLTDHRGRVWSAGTSGKIKKPGVPHCRSRAVWFFVVRCGSGTTKAPPNFVITPTAFLSARYLLPMCRPVISNTFGSLKTQENFM